MSTLLLHGPGTAARQAALNEADRIGRLLAEPMGDDGINIDTARQIVEVLGAAPLGDDIGVIVVGPMDLPASTAALDALLKFLEEYDDRFMQVILWARDVEHVRSTIRSRCIERWCPSFGTGGPEVAYMRTAKSLCEAALRRRVATVVEILKENKGSEEELLQASARVLSEETEWSLSARLLLWASLREALTKRSPGPSHYETVSAYMV